MDLMGPWYHKTFWLMVWGDLNVELQYWTHLTATFSGSFMIDTSTTTQEIDNDPNVSLAPARTCNSRLPLRLLPFNCFISRRRLAKGTVNGQALG
jgi:hypothetical protein